MKRLTFIAFLSLQFTQLCDSQLIMWTYKMVGPGRLRDVAFVDSLYGWAVGDSGRVYATTDGGANWHPQARIVFAQLNSVSFVDRSVGYAAGYWSALLKTTDGGDTWSLLVGPSGGGNWAQIHFVSADVGWLLRLDGAARLKTTTDGGVSWSDVSPTNWDVLQMYFLDDTLGWATDGGSILHTTNGNNWVDIGATSSWWLDKVYFPTQSRGYAIHNYPGTTESTILSRSTNGGVNWDTIKSLFHFDVQDLWFVDSLEGWATGWEVNPSLVGGSIYHTSDGGVNWVRELLLDVTELYAMLYKSVFTDKLNGWSVGGTTTNQAVVARYGVTPVAVEPDRQELPVFSGLRQNYPNPFNPSTEITYHVPEAFWVTLKVFDVLGKETAVLVNEMKEPGEYHVTWNAANVPSGVYFCRLTAGKSVLSNKMLLTK